MPHLNPEQQSKVHEVVDNYKVDNYKNDERSVERKIATISGELRTNSLNGTEIFHIPLLEAGLHKAVALARELLEQSNIA